MYSCNQNIFRQYYIYITARIQNAKDVIPYLAKDVFQRC